MSVHCDILELWYTVQFMIRQMVVAPIVGVVSCIVHHLLALSEKLKNNYNYTDFVLLTQLSPRAYHESQRRVEVLAVCWDMITFRGQKRRPWHLYCFGLLLVSDVAKSFANIALSSAMKIDRCSCLNLYWLLFIHRTGFDACITCGWAEYPFRALFDDGIWYSVRSWNRRRHILCPQVSCFVLSL